jgi:hypothetical protein
MNAADHVRLRQHEDVVVPAQVTWMIGKSPAAKIRFAQPLTLDHRTHRAVQEQEALTGDALDLVKT